MGAAMAAGVMSGLFTDFKAAAKSMVHISRTITPNPELAEVYQEKYDLYQKVVKDQSFVWNDIGNTQLETTN